MKKTLLILICALATRGYAADTLARIDTSLNTVGEADYFATRSSIEIERQEANKKDQAELRAWSDSLQTLTDVDIVMTHIEWGIWRGKGKYQTVEVIPRTYPGCNILYQIVNGYALFNEGTENIYHSFGRYPMAVKIWDSKAKLYPGISICDCLAGSVIGKTKTIKMETITGFMRDVSLYEVIPYDKKAIINFLHTMTDAQKAAFLIDKCGLQDRTTKEISFLQNTVLNENAWRLVDSTR